MDSGGTAPNFRLAVQSPANVNIYSGTPAAHRTPASGLCSCWVGAGAEQAQGHSHHSPRKQDLQREPQSGMSEWCPSRFLQKNRPAGPALGRPCRGCQHKLPSRLWLPLHPTCLHLPRQTDRRNLGDSRQHLHRLRGGLTGRVRAHSSLEPGKQLTLPHQTLRNDQRPKPPARVTAQPGSPTSWSNSTQNFHISPETQDNRAWPARARHRCGTVPLPISDQPITSHRAAPC